MTETESRAMRSLRSEQARIAVIGGGKMGEAILGGWIASRTGEAALWDASNFVVADTGAQRRDYLQKTYGVACVDSPSHIGEADLVLLSVKPQVMFNALPSMQLDALADALFVSIAAGIATEKLEGALPVGTHVVRVMPNIPLQIGAGATTLCAGSNATASDAEFVRDLFDCIGQAFIVDEDMMDVTGAINGCGPAYAAALVEALADAGAEFGLDYDLAEKLAAQTIMGTGRMMAEKGQSAQKTRIDVCSPGGTTLAALDAMSKAGFQDSLRAGVEAAVRRSKELGA